MCVLAYPFFIPKHAKIRKHVLALCFIFTLAFILAFKIAFTSINLSIAIPGFQA
jgi:hypothetical protein